MWTSEMTQKLKGNLYVGPLDITNLGTTSKLVKDRLHYGERVFEWYSYYVYWMTAPMISNIVMTSTAPRTVTSLTLKQKMNDN